MLALFICLCFIGLWALGLFDGVGNDSRPGPYDWVDFNASRYSSGGSSK